jgi:hypothetical protein
VQLRTAQALAHGVIAPIVAAVACCCCLLLLYGGAELQQLVAVVLLQYTWQDGQAAGYQQHSTCLQQ